MKKIKFLPLIFLIGVVLIEIILRVTDTGKLRRFTRPQYIVDTELGYRYLPNSKGFKTTAAFSNEYKINSAGFNWDEFEVEKAPGMFRIIVIGTSDDTGIDTDGPNCYARLLQEKFRKNGDSIEIMNFSIDGQNRTLANIDLAYRCAEKYKPDLILTNTKIPIKTRKEYRTTYNGVQIGYFKKEQSLEKAKKIIDEKVTKPSTFATFYDNSYVVRKIIKVFIERPKNPISQFIYKFILTNKKFVKGYVRNKVTLKKVPIKELSIEESINVFEKASDSIQLLNSKLVLFMPYKVPKEYIPDSIFNSKIEFLWLDIERLPEYSFGKKDSHTNQIGHKVIFENFYEKLRAENLIPEKYFSN